MKRVCVFYYDSWSGKRDRLIAARPKYVVLDLSAWPTIPNADIAACENAGITMCAYVPTGGMRGYIWNAQDTTVKTPVGLKSLIDQAFSKGFTGVFFDEGGLYTPVSGQTYQDAFLDPDLQAPGRNAGNPPILSIVGNSKYNPTTADSWLGLTAKEYINHARSKGMFVIVGLPDEYVRPSRINNNIFPIVDAVLTSEEYNTRTPGLNPVGQEIPFTGQCFVLSYNGQFDAPATLAALNYGFGAAYCCEAIGTLSSNFESYMAQIPEEGGDMADYIFMPGESKIAVVPVTNALPGQVYGVEVWLGPDDSHKVVTSGIRPFTAPPSGAGNVNCPVVMPTAPGIYTTFVDLTIGGFMLQGLIDTNKVVIPGGSVGPPDWQ